MCDLNEKVALKLLIRGGKIHRKVCLYDKEQASNNVNDPDIVWNKSALRIICNAVFDVNVARECDAVAAAPELLRGTLQARVILRRWR